MKSQKRKEKKSWIPIFIIGTIVLSLVFLFVIQKQEEKSTNIAGLPPGTPAPEFTLESTKGEINLSEYKGKNIILYFYEGNT